MSGYYLGMIATMGFNFAPRGWAFCAGQILPIAQNTALFALLGTTFGGNGQSTFGLPDLRGRVAVGQGQGPGLDSYSMGEIVGTENTTLLITELPIHSHTVPNMATAVKASEQLAAAGDYLGKTVDAAPTPTSVPKIYVPAASATSPYHLGAANTGLTGSSTPFSTLQPILGMNQCIATTGIFPARN